MPVSYTHLDVYKRQRSQIADHVWNYDFEYDSNVVDVYIRYLRNKIDRDFSTKLIHTVRGVGYVMREEP